MGSSGTYLKQPPAVWHTWPCQKPQLHIPCELLPAQSPPVTTATGLLQRLCNKAAMSCSWKKVAQEDAANNMTVGLTKLCSSSKQHTRAFRYWLITCLDWAVKHEEVCIGMRADRPETLKQTKGNRWCAQIENGRRWQVVVHDVPWAHTGHHNT